MGGRDHAEVGPLTAVGGGVDRAPAAGDHGGDADAVARWLGVPASEVLDLSASLNPVAPDVRPVVARGLDALTRYPDDGLATELLASAIGVDPRLLVLTNGGAEAIALVAMLEPIGAIEEPEFSLYRRHLDAVVEGAPRWRSNPSNPLGRLADAGDTARVWDEAFWQVATGTWTRGDRDSWRLGSLTKLWACPGLRLGYAIAPTTAEAEQLRRRRPRWSVNGLALAALPELLAATDLPAWSADVAERRADLADQLRQRGLTTTETRACWVLVTEPGLRQRLLPHGVVVRDCTTFGMPGTFRVAVPDDRGLDRLLTALEG